MLAAPVRPAIDASIFSHADFARLQCMVGAKAASQQSKAELQVGDGLSPHARYSARILLLIQKRPIEAQQRTLARKRFRGAPFIESTRGKTLQTRREIMLRPCPPRPEKKQIRLPPVGETP